MDDITKKILEELVINFISEMNDWEKYCKELDPNTQLVWEEADRMMEQRVAYIINKYCTDNRLCKVFYFILFSLNSLASIISFVEIWCKSSKFNLIPENNLEFHPNYHN